MAVIYAFGDSITYGEWDVSASGWAARLRECLDGAHDKGEYRIFYNLGIPGDTTTGLLKRFESEYHARHDQEEEDIFLFAFGANDSMYLINEKKCRLSLDEFRANFEIVLKKAKGFSSKMILVGITPVVEDPDAAPDKPNPYNTFISNENIQRYNAVIRELAEKYTAQFIDAYSEYMKIGHTKLFTKDGLHPNDEGHKIIFEMIKPELEKLL